VRVFYHITTALCYNDDNDTWIRVKNVKHCWNEILRRPTLNKATQLKIGDTVIVQKPRTNKLSSFYDPRPYTITAINGSMITAERENHTITRNSSHFKKIHYRDQSMSPNSDRKEEEDFDELDLPTTPPRPPRPPAVPPERRYPRRNRRPPQNLRDFVPR